MHIETHWSTLTEGADYQKSLKYPWQIKLDYESTVKIGYGSPLKLSAFLA